MLFGFADYEFDAERYELRQQGRSIPVEARVLEVLAYLIRHRNRLVTKDELLDAVWGDREVTEATLERSISLLRGALGDRQRPRRFVGTVYGRGYRFLEPVELRVASTAAARPAFPVVSAPDPHEVASTRTPQQLLERGRELSIAGDGVRARETLLSARNAARAARAPELLARAAVAYADATSFQAENDALALALLEDALAMLPRSAVRLRAELLSRIACVETSEAAWDVRAGRIQEAIALARRSGHDATLLSVLNAGCVALKAPDRLEECMDLSTEAVALATRMKDPIGALWAYRNRMTATLPLPDLTLYDRDLASYTSVAGALGNPVFLLLAEAWSTARAAATGREKNLEERSDELIRRFAVLGDTAAVAMVCLGPILRERQQIEGVLRFSSIYVEKYPLVRATLAALSCDIGMVNAAREHFEVLAADRFRAVPWDLAWLGSMVMLSDVCDALGDVTRAEELYEQLLPYEAYNGVMGSGGFYGPVSHSLGLLATTSFRLDAAERHLRLALRNTSRMRVPVHHAHAQVSLVRVLLSRRTPQREAEARALIADVRTSAGDVAFRRVHARLRNLEKTTRT